MNKYVLLMRHGKHETAGPSNSPGCRLTKEGKSETKNVAGRLASALDELKINPELRMCIGGFWTADSDEAKKTADVVSKVLGELADCTPEAVQGLKPIEFNAYKNTGIHNCQKIRKM